ncbi:uncharacterized protein LOC128234326 [Mya arenaria]|uniref:uncharacterized protein LOC128234326 n=1 Tax=Mya arenaria TaxID=6604 RepID=UPI0022E343B4|nr:uncharacterized protein LOC128234326 [Mya arenaria]
MNFNYSLLESHTFKHSTALKISFKASNEDYGKRIRCSTECQYFQNTLTNSTNVIFAKKPKVVINSTPVLPVSPKTYIVLTCAANSHPVGNITWTMVKTSHSLFAQTTLCYNTSTCIYELTTSDVEQEYECIANNEHGSDRGSIIVTVQERKEKKELIQSERGSFLWIVVSVIAVVTLGSFVLIVCGCRKRWNRVYENINTHQVRNMYQGIAVTSLNRPTELDETTSPRVYDEIDENNLSMVQAETSLTTDETGNNQIQRENSKTYDTISETISTGTHTSEMTHDYSAPTNLGSLRQETDSEGREGYLHVIYELH